MEAESMRFYQAAAKRTTNLALRKLLDELPLAEQLHLDLAGKLHREVDESGARTAEDQTHRRTFVSSDHSTRSGGTHGWICLDLSSRLRAAFATRDSWDAFLIGMAASIAAGISMGFAEALSDDGVLSGRGRPFIRGLVCGLMTTIGRRWTYLALPHHQLSPRNAHRISLDTSEGLDLLFLNSITGFGPNRYRQIAYQNFHYDIHVPTQDRMYLKKPLGRCTRDCSLASL